METRKLGRNGPSVPALGLGCMGMTGIYGEPNEPESIATIHRAIDLGVNLIVTSDAYGAGTNEELVGRAIKGKRDRVLVATKFGNMGLSGFKLAEGQSGGHPAYVPQACEASLKRLGVDVIDIYGLHRVDPKVPIEDTVGAVAEMVKAGYVRHIGLSEAAQETIRRAHAVHPITALQIEYSIFSRGIEREILPTVRELGISVTAYGVLSRGLIADRPRGEAVPPGEIRTRMPRFQGDNYVQNLAVVDALRSIAKEKGCSVAQLAFAWVRSRGEDIVPLVGARRRDQLAEAIVALGVTLSAPDVARIDAAVRAKGVMGERYSPALMAHLDSERG